MAQTIANGLAGATAAEVTAGMEIEICPARTPPGLDDGIYYSQDQLITAIVNHVTAQGHTATCDRKPGAFVFAHPLTVYQQIRRLYTHGNTVVEAIEVTWSRAIRYYVRTFDAAGNVRTTQRIACSTVPPERLAARADAAVAAALGVPLASATMTRTDIVMLPDAEKWRAFFRIAPHPPGGFTVTPLNGRSDPRAVNADDITIRDETFHVAARSFDDAREQILHYLCTTRHALQRNDTLTHLAVGGIPGTFVWHYEPFPYREFVTPKLLPEQFPVVRHIVGAFAALGIVGTMPNTQISTHVHVNAPLRVAGRLSIAPLLSMARSHLRSDRLVRAAIPPNPDGLMFVAPMSKPLRRRITRADYCTNPTDPRQILCVMADFITCSRPKLSALNFDNAITEIGRALLADGHVRLGDKPFEITWHGRLYRFFVVPHVSEHTPDILVEYNGERRSLLRVPLKRAKSTYEFRGFTTVHSETTDADGPTTYALDPDSFLYFMQFAAARAWLDSVKPFA